eukprot:TRINITY_DN11478_c0_g1_i14.p1 TRINITY_DN11478_c0_g1~~TRINITY_DN11478_c0_g1_i14.p1  ORF type:complete len:400 (-),score=48.11 TRINITY_DN11478_c0_g1_i14:257-1456(-)
MKGVVLILLLSLLAYWFVNLSGRFDFNKTLLYTDNRIKCTPLRGPLGAEDLIRWGDYVLTSNLDSLPLWNWPGTTDPTVSSADSTPQGTIWVIGGLNSSRPEIYPATLIDFPKQLALHPHGLGIWKDHEGDRLFVVNHAYSNGGERVDVFELSQKGSTVFLRYVSHIGFNSCCIGTINDVAPVSRNEFYVTKYLPYSDAITGRRIDSWSKFRSILYSTVPLKWTSIFFCSNISGTSETQCKEVGPAGGMWNGITSSPDGSTIYVYDLFDRHIFAFERTATNDLVVRRKYFTEYAADNIQYDPVDGRIWYGGMALVGQCVLKWLGDYEHHPGAPRKARSPEGHLCPIHSTSLDLNTGEEKHHVIHNGTLLGAASASVRFGDHVIIGSFVDDGVLLCPYQK